MCLIHNVRFLSFRFIIFGFRPQMITDDVAHEHSQHDLPFNIICIMGLLDISNCTVECQMLSQLKRLVHPCRRIR